MQEQLPGFIMSAKSFESLARVILNASTHSKSAAEIELLSRRLLDHYGKTFLPQGNETIGISVQSPMTAALYFDRVWWPPEPVSECAPPPDELKFYAATDFEIWGQALFTELDDTALEAAAFENAETKSVFKSVLEKLKVFDRQTDPRGHLLLSRVVSESTFDERKIIVTPMYETMAASDREYRPGDQLAIVAAINDLGIVNEGSLTWEQVLEFRADADAKLKLRRMRNWLDSAYAGKSVAQITDAIAIRLDDYEWALKKHGVSTILGTASEMLDAKVLSATSAAVASLAYAEGAFWAALGGAGLLVGRALVSLSTKKLDLVDRKRGQSSEIVFVHELKKLTK